ncbi:MAG TPA: hypothetical protein VFV99_25090 [Kofleriaceae bacterium]|nr:hypothetical protein [Kofleriaceae bacterium]
MRFHLPSYLLGVATGASGAAIVPRLRPVVMEIASGCYRLVDAVTFRAARARENFSDFLAEAHARARDGAQRRIGRRERAHA